MHLRLHVLLDHSAKLRYMVSLSIPAVSKNAAAKIPAATVLPDVSLFILQFADVKWLSETRQLLCVLCEMSNLKSLFSNDNKLALPHSGNGARGRFCVFTWIRNWTVISPHSGSRASFALQELSSTVSDKRRRRRKKRLNSCNRLALLVTCSGLQQLVRFTLWSSVWMHMPNSKFHKFKMRRLNQHSRMTHVMKCKLHALVKIQQRGQYNASFFQIVFTFLFKPVGFKLAVWSGSVMSQFQFKYEQFTIEMCFSQTAKTWGGVGWGCSS